MIAGDIADLFALRNGRASSGNADFGAIARVFGLKILWPRKIFENFAPKFAENGTESHAPRRAVTLLWAVNKTGAIC